MKTNLGQQLIEASRILRSQIAAPLVSKTIDVCSELNEVERKALLYSEKFKIKRLLEKNP